MHPAPLNALVRLLRPASNGAARGLSVLEVLVAALVLGVLALMIFTAFAIGVRALALAGGMNTALGLAEETLAVATADPCASPALTFALAEPPPLPPPYERDLSVIPRPEPRQYEVRVTVQWTQGRLRRSLSLVTLHTVSAACAVAGP